MSSQVIEQEGPNIPLTSVTTREINTSGGGPFYVYLPGFTVYDLMRMTHSFSHIPAGEAFRIGSTEVWAAKEQLPEGAARKESVLKDWQGHVLNTLYSVEIPPQVTLDCLLSDHALTTHGLAVLRSFDALDAAHETLNTLIQPVVIEERTYPMEWRKTLETEGMLHLRRRWLEEAAERLSSDRMDDTNVTVRRVLESRPELRRLWYDAITGVMIPAVNGFEETANSILAQKEELVRDGQKKGYDPYDNLLMWLLNRKPERTALSRTLEGAGKGVGIDEIRALVEGVVGATRNGGAAVAEQVQCSDCGEFVNMIAGGPPRKCRHCGFEFRREGPIVAIAAGAPIEEEAVGNDTALGVAAALVSEDDIDRLADKILNERRQ